MQYLTIGRFNYKNMIPMNGAPGLVPKLAWLGHFADLAHAKEVPNPLDLRLSPDQAKHETLFLEATVDKRSRVQMGRIADLKVELFVDTPGWRVIDHTRRRDPRMLMCSVRYRTDAGQRQVSDGSYY